MATRQKRTTSTKKARPSVVHKKKAIKVLSLENQEATMLEKVGVFVFTALSLSFLAFVILRYLQ